LSRLLRTDCGRKRPIHVGFLRNFYTPASHFFPIFTLKKIRYIHFIGWRLKVDIVFLPGIGLLWGMTAGLTMGFERLETPTRRSP